MYYIEKNDKPTLFIKILNLPIIKENKIILPVKNKESQKNSIKLAKKTKKILDKTRSNKIVISRDLKKDEIYTNMLYSYNYNIVDGKWLFEAISCIVVDYISNVKGLKKEETQVSVLVNYLTQYTFENIKKLAKEYKGLNIVTNHIQKFKNLEEKLHKEEGILITVTNNKKKSLLKSAIILNIDFPTELINKFNIQEKAIIINVCGNVKINKKKFEGININDYEIKIRKRLVFRYKQKPKLLC